MVFKFSSQRKDSSATDPAQKSEFAEDPCGGQKVCESHRGLAKAAHFGAEVQWVSEMIQQDAQRCLDLEEKIKALETQIEQVAKPSQIAKILISLPGFGPVCSTELAGEIGTIERFSKEGSLALYLGMSTLDNSSGKYQGSKAPKHVNTRAKAAMMIGLDRHRKCVPESQKYYEKKRGEGKKHNQAIRALGRHLCRVIYKKLKEEREYEIRPEKGNTKTKVSARSSFKTQIRRSKISVKEKK